MLSLDEDDEEGEDGEDGDTMKRVGDGDGEERGISSKKIQSIVDEYEAQIDAGGDALGGAIGGGVSGGYGGGAVGGGGVAGRGVGAAESSAEAAAAKWTAEAFTASVDDDVDRTSTTSSDATEAPVPNYAEQEQAVMDAMDAAAAKALGAGKSMRDSSGGETPP
jgi:hypothetical protein